MKMAYSLALKGKNTVSPNPMVGAVIVKSGKVIARGFHHHCGGPHAEIVALNNAKGNVKGAKLYVTLEPCFHFGRTPPCVDAIIASGIKEVIIGMPDPNIKTNGKSISKLKKAGIKVQVGVLQEQLMDMNEAFVKYITKKMPFVVAKTAQTLDGKIATRTGESKWITSLASREMAHTLRNEFDAIIVGINTVLKDNPGLNAPGKNLKKIILDSSLRISLQAKLFENVLLEHCWIATTKKANKKKILSFQKAGVNVLICPAKESRVDLKWLMAELAKKEITKVLIEGGAHVIGSALKEKLVDRMLIFISPQIMGDRQAQSSIDGLKVVHLKEAIHLQSLAHRKIGQDFFIEAAIK